jgi:hypothetical protein
MAHHPRCRKIPGRSIEPIEPEGWHGDLCRALGLELFELPGALSLMAISISNLLPILQRTEPHPQRGEPLGKP